MPRSRNWPIGFAQTDHVRTGKEGEGRVVPGAPRIRRSPLARPTVALARLERTNRSATSKGRKKDTDTRDKTELVGLIIKAGLRYERHALLLSALLEPTVVTDPTKVNGRGWPSLHRSIVPNERVSASQLTITGEPSRSMRW